MRLILARAAAARTLLLAAAAAATVTTVLLTAFLLYAERLPEAGVRAAVVQAPAADRSLLLRAPAGRDRQQVAALDREAREVFADGLAGLPLRVSAGGYATSQRLPDDLPGVDVDSEAYAVVAFLPDLPDHAALVAGAWPEPVSPGAPAQAALPATVAGELGLAVGDRVAILDEIAREEAPLVVVGLWQPHEPDGGYWRLASTRLHTGGLGPFLVHPDEFLDRYSRLAIQEWVAVPDAAALGSAGTGAILAGYRAVLEDLARRQDDGRLEAARLTTGVGDLAARLETATVVNRSGLVLPAALLVVISGYGLVLLARLLTAHRRGQQALLRARGAGRRQLVMFTAGEAALVVAPAAVLGAPVATRLVALADSSGGQRSLGVAADLAGYGWPGPPLAWAVALSAALGCALALALPAAGRGRTWVAEQQERSRPGRLARAHRAGVDLALVALAVLAWSQLRQYGTAVSPTAAGGLGLDPLLVLAPVLGVLAATAVALRLLPVATRLGVRWAARRDSFPGLLGMWQADRRPHAGPVLLLVLAVASAVLAPAVAATWQRSQHDQATRMVGADLRLDGWRVEQGPPVAPSALSGAVMPVHRTPAFLEGGRSTLLALDSDRAPGVALVRDDLSGTPVEELFGRLHDGRPEVSGVPLPSGAQRLAGRIRFEAPEFAIEVRQRILPTGEVLSEPVEVPGPTVSGHAVHVADAAGAVRTILPSVPPTPGVTDFEVPLPATATALVGLGATARATQQYFFALNDGEPVPVSWHWQDLRVVDAAGVETPLAVPDDWVANVRGEGTTSQRIGTEVAVAAELSPTDTGLRQSFLLAAPHPQLSVIPAVVTPDILAAAGVEVGQSLTVAGLFLQAVGTVAVMPGTPDGSGIAIDLTWVTVHQFVWQRVPPSANEWWVATADPPATAAVAAAAGMTVHDRAAETGILLGDPLATGVLLALWTAAVAAALLAAFGVVVDSRATAVQRQRELAVLHTLGTTPPALARALVVEQATLAGLGVAAGAVAGLAVAAAMGTSLVLTPIGEVPVPPPLLTVSPPLVAAPTFGLLLVAVALGALVARRARREVAAGALRIGED
jgi:hypothetical protein